MLPVFAVSIQSGSTSGIPPPSTSACQRLRLLLSLSVSLLRHFSRIRSVRGVRCQLRSSPARTVSSVPAIHPGCCRQRTPIPCAARRPTSSSSRSVCNFRSLPVSSAACSRCRVAAASSSAWRSQNHSVAQRCLGCIGLLVPWFSVRPRRSASVRRVGRWSFLTERPPWLTVTQFTTWSRDPRMRLSIEPIAATGNNPSATRRFGLSVPSTAAAWRYRRLAVPYAALRAVRAHPCRRLAWELVRPSSAAPFWFALPNRLSLLLEVLLQPCRGRFHLAR